MSYGLGESLIALRSSLTAGLEGVNRLHHLSQVMVAHAELVEMLQRAREILDVRSAVAAAARDHLGGPLDGQRAYIARMPGVRDEREDGHFRARQARVQHARMVH